MQSELNFLDEFPPEGCVGVWVFGGGAVGVELNRFKFLLEFIIVEGLTLKSFLGIVHSLYNNSL